MVFECPLWSWSDDVVDNSWTDCSSTSSASFSSNFASDSESDISEKVKENRHDSISFKSIP